MAWVTYSDFIELREKLRTSKLSFFLGKFSFDNKKRVASNWNAHELPPTNWWNIPMVRKRWNEKITGDSSKSYITYCAEQYFTHVEDGLKMLSIGCGTGTQELEFLNTGKFKLIEAIDIAEGNIVEAKKRTSNPILKFIHSSFERFETSEKYDVILFYSSLHHLKNLEGVVKRIKQLLLPNSLLIIHEYTGPNRIAWQVPQLNFSNKLLAQLPDNKRTYLSGNVKEKQTAPGNLRMIISDPSEAVEAENIVNILKQHFTNVELKGYGGNILVPLLKGISHHFIESNEENIKYLTYFFQQEDEFLKNHQDDYHFGVYRNK